MKTTKSIAIEATIQADETALEAESMHKESNGSEAWQAVIVKVDGRSKVAKELLALGYPKFRKDSYWGILTSSPCSNYYAEEAWTNKFAAVLTANGIPARRVERLL